MACILKLENLSKCYGKIKVVDSFNLSIEKGHIYGLIGPNGAGKTTIMKMIAGLTEISDGRIGLFGDFDNLMENRSRTSFMIEAPYLDNQMTARQNLEYIRFLRGVANEKRIDEVLNYVGLSDVGNKKVKHFSLGMKQRLGIAIALLPSPEIMVLDEPVNGLDPEGIVDIRNILKCLCEEEGITILISSHLLSELSELCTDFTIINNGKLVESLSKEELKRKCKNHLVIRTNQIDNTVAVLEQKINICDYKVVEEEEIHLYERLDEIELISKTITDTGIVILKLVLKGERLEDYYLTQIKNDVIRTQEACLTPNDKRGDYHE